MVGDVVTQPSPVQQLQPTAFGAACLAYKQRAGMFSPKLRLSHSEDLTTVSKA